MSPQSKHLLLVEDDPSLGATLQERLQKEGYSVSWAQTQVEGEAAFKKKSPDLVILDVGLPDGSGFDLARKIKAESHVPFIFVTAMTTAEYRLEGFELGAEEYIPKPFHLKEILMRVKHVLENHSVAREIIANGCRIDLLAMSITDSNGAKEFLPARDFKLLKFLIETSPRVISRDEILNQVWGEDKFPSSRTIDNSIVRLRQLLGDSEGNWIRSVRGIGYQWAKEGENE
ncbi:MAG: response regulator transcription factor [Bdellovibrionia bacterium]